MANASLPVLPAWHARSFYASLLLALTVIGNAFGWDPLPWLAHLGLGTTPDQVVEKIMLLAPLGFGLWAWWERRAPHYRLSLSLRPPLQRVVEVLSGAIARLRAFLVRLWSRMVERWRDLWGWGVR
ncbi:hypothetical protein [Frigidibacter oleivorans]|uniref:hypothetical protein n=1 Tax=Frigidibacter oleivorans TaxID=2487129 RepID=UPI000F8D9B58|nr:hypothetical protein [Frigidibacter oleivorans]